MPVALPGTKPTPSTGVDARKASTLRITEAVPRWTMSGIEDAGASVPIERRKAEVTGDEDEANAQCWAARKTPDPITPGDRRAARRPPRPRFSVACRG